MFASGTMILPDREEVERQVLAHVIPGKEEGALQDSLRFSFSCVSAFVFSLFGCSFISNLVWLLVLGV